MLRVTLFSNPGSFVVIKDVVILGTGMLPMYDIKKKKQKKNGTNRNSVVSDVKSFLIHLYL